MQNQLSNFKNYKGLCKINLSHMGTSPSRIHVTGICPFVLLFVCLLGLACRFARFARFFEVFWHQEANRTAFGFWKMGVVSMYVVGCFRTHLGLLLILGKLAKGDA